MMPPKQPSSQPVELDLTQDAPPPARPTPPSRVHEESTPSGKPSLLAPPSPSPYSASLNTPAQPPSTTPRASRSYKPTVTPAAHPLRRPAPTPSSTWLAPLGTTPLQQPSSSETPASTIRKRKSSTPLRSLPPPSQRAVSGTPSFAHYDSSTDEDASDYEGHAFPVARRGFPNLQSLDEFPDLTGNEVVDSIYRAPTEDTGDPIRALIDNIPLDSDDDDAPVGVRRRKIAAKKKEDKNVDHETGAGIQTFDLTDEPDDHAVDHATEEEIEKDRRRIERAAKNLGCKKVVVKVHRREEILGDERGEAFAGGDVREVEVAANVVPKPRKRNPRGILSVLDEKDDDSDQEDLQARPPGAPAPQPNAVEETANAPVGSGNEEAMEVIQGDQLGRNITNTKFKDVVEEKIRWRVPGMKSPLLDHQCLGVNWMLSHEMSKGRPHGGLVADVMGLGKTIQAISVMILNPPPDDSEARVTLIVCPVALLQQWKDEIALHAKKNAFRKVYINHGPNKLKRVADLKREDVVLVSYSTIMNSCPPTKPPKDEKLTPAEYQIWFQDQWDNKRGIFHRMKFWRVILDESHIIRNRRSRTSVACQRLESENTWCLSGTPFQNKVDDIFPVFAFLKHPQAGYLENWNNLMSQASESVKCQRVQLCLRKCFMRRLKTDILVGKPLITLPKKRVRMVELEFGEEERALYMVVENKTRDKINSFIRKGQATKSFSHILTMLLRLRQICDHPYLILESISNEFSADDIDAAMEMLNEENALKADDSDAELENRPRGSSQRPTRSTRNKRSSSAPCARSSQPTHPSALGRILETARTRPHGQSETCHSCSSPVIDPVMGRCRHTLCRDCFSDLLSTTLDLGLPALCPTCGSSLKEHEMREVASPEDEDNDADSDWLSAFQPFAHSAKTIALRDQLREWRQNHPGDKVVLFSQFVKMLDIAEYVVAEENWGFVRYQGSMKLSEREEALTSLRTNPDTHIMLTSIKAGGVGLNLTSANLVISLDLWWNAATELQAFDRVHRLGQAKEVFVTRMMVKATVEERILKLQEAKLAIGKAAMGEGKAALGKLSIAELLGLFGTYERNAESGRMELRADYGGADLMGRAREVARGRRERGV